MGSRLKLFVVMFAVIALLTLVACGGGGSAGRSSPPPPAVHNEWIWAGGSNVVDPVGVYGTLGMAAPSNVPGGRVNAVGWTDALGNFWLFGGYGTASNTGSEGDHNDLWKFSGGEWTWMNGSNQIEQSGTYGIKGAAATGNVPGARWQSASWTDAAGNFWLFGGLGVDSAGTRGDLSDLWKYSNGEWTWMGGSNLSAQVGIAGAYQGTGVYGIQGVAAPANLPGARVSASTWTDKSGNLWLFGGLAVDSTGKLGVLNDLWRYSAGEWTWMAGANVANQYGTYGTKGTPAPANTPGARSDSATWTDAVGNFWLFGGIGNDVDGTRCQQTGSPCDLSDLWKYSGGEWTWMGGPDQANEPGVYGTQGVAAPANIPPPRDSALSWTDVAGNFWLFGGIIGASNLNDLWKYSNGEWTWVSGASQACQPSAYGTQGKASPGNIPGARNGAVDWTDGSGNLWFFGGAETFCVGNGKFNDLWEYQP